MPEEMRTICTQEMVRGFRDACTEAGTAITGGQTVLNPWPIIGGVATSIVAEGEFVPSDGARCGDVVVLTKPLGTQIAVNVHQWKHEHRTKEGGNRFWTQCMDEQILNEEEHEAENMMHAAVSSMARLNNNAGKLLLKYHASACTDVTGFGILGHAQNLSENQVAEVGIELHTLPCIKGTPKVNNAVFNFRLLSGYSAETSGGLMSCMKQEDAIQYCAELEQLDGTPSWIIGNVVHSTEKKSKIVDDVKVIEV